MQKTSPRPDTDFAIVGSGIHGTVFARAIQRYLPKLRILSIDPFARPLGLWTHRTTMSGMLRLRSPASHNIDTSFRSLLRFAHNNNYGKEHFELPYHRPSLELFQKHCEKILDELNIDRMEARLLNIRRGAHLVLHTDRGDVSTRYVLLALGHGDVNIPSWIEDEPEKHIFHPDFTPPPPDHSPCIVGAGLSAIQFALSLIQKGERTVHIISHHPICITQFDSNPCYIGPACRGLFLDLNDYQKRRTLIHAMRHTGTTTPDTAKRMYKAIQSNKLILHQDKVQACKKTPDGKYSLVLDFSPDLVVDDVVIATGFCSTPPDPSLLNRCSESLDLKFSSCGYPIPDRWLQWCRDVFLSGSLAELEIGPPARNIIGAHLAMRRIIPYLIENGYAS